MILAEELKKHVLSDEYFILLYERAEKMAAQKLFGVEADLLSKREYQDLMRYADILSHSNDPDARNKAYKVVALLDTEEIEKNEFKLYAEAILTKLGNFPALKYLSNSYGDQVILPIEREVERGFKKVVHRTHDKELTFTDPQYKVRAELEKYDFFSFSGPTSIGKSFIIKDYIHSLLDGSEIDNGCIVILVPTRALIDQVVKELRNEITNHEINITAFPSSSTYIQNKYKRTVYVFTPERLLSYVANNAVNVRYLFIDEAQKIVSINDSRSSLYYHAIYETIRKFATKLVFASPNIPNPDIFLNIFEKDQRGSVAITEKTVSQNRYFVDLLNKQIIFYSDVSLKNDHYLDPKGLPSTSDKLVTVIGSNVNNLIYCNGTAETVRRARTFAESLGYVESTPALLGLIKFIEEYVHKDYYLINCLKKGVAFHHGRMPQQIRRKVEDFFTDKDTDLRYMFCTSTLLEGVNLPAKNIFVLNDYHGSKKFKKIDFENLIGRAGRLTKEFSGNVICVRDSDQRWKANDDLLKLSKPEHIESFLVDPNKAKKKEFSNIGKALSGAPMAKSLTGGERDNLNHYASIMLLHHLENEGSSLKVKFLEKDKHAQEILQLAKRNNNVPSNILRVSSTIKPKYQNLALKYIANGEDTGLPKIEKDSDLTGILERIYDLYNWEEEESIGRDPLIPQAMASKGYGKLRLKYWAMLMKHWINSEPLNRLILYSAYFYRERGTIWFREDGRMINESFTGNAKQINIIIEQILNDIENGLRFRIEKYMLNYYLLCKFQLGEQNAGQNWAELIEYGTANRRAIELQNAGFSRSTAVYLLDNNLDCLVFDQTVSLVDINEEKLLANISADNEHYDEIKEILRPQ